MGWASVSATTGSYGYPSAASAWQKFTTLGLQDGSDDVDFLYTANSANPAIANAVIPIRVVSKAEAP